MCVVCLSWTTGVLGPKKVGGLVRLIKGKRKAGLGAAGPLVEI